MNNIPDLPPIDGTSSQLLRAINDRLRMIPAVVTKAAQSAVAAVRSPTPPPSTGSTGSGSGSGSGTGAALLLTLSNLSGQQGIPFTATLAATGGDGNYTYSLPVGALPTGVTLDPTTGQLSGDPLISGAFTFTAKVVDTSGLSVTESFTITISPAISPVTSVISAVTGSIAGRYAYGDGSTHVTINIAPTFTSGSGSQNLTVWLYFRRKENTAPAWYWIGVGQIVIGGTIAIDALLCAGASVAAQVAVEAGSVQGDPTVALGSPPAGAVSSGTFTMVLGAPNAGNTTAFLYNIQGTVATQSNVFVGINPLHNPYWNWRVDFQTGGTSDADTWEYVLWAQWVDSSGNPINPGGEANQSGWQNVASCVNDGRLHTFTGSPGWNYPGQGIDGYMEWRVYGRNKNSTVSVAPYTGDPNATLQTCWTSSADHTRLEIGQPPTNSINSGASALGQSLIFDPSFSILGFLAQAFASTTGGAFVPTTWAAPTFGQQKYHSFNGNSGSNIIIRTNLGNSDTFSLEFISDGVHTPTWAQYVATAPSIPYNLSFSVQSNNDPLGSHQLEFLLNWCDKLGNLIRQDGPGSVTGYFSTWGNVYFGSVTAPSASTLSSASLPVAFVTVEIFMPTTCPVNDTWIIDDIIFAPVVQQVSNSQQNTMVPQSLTSGYSGLNINQNPVAGTAVSNYGLSIASIGATDGSTISMLDYGGTAGFQYAFTSGPGNNSQGSLEGTNSFSKMAVLIGSGGSQYAFSVQVTTSAISLVMVSAGTAYTGYSGTGKPSQYVAGIAVSALSISGTAYYSGAVGSGRALGTVYQNPGPGNLQVLVSVFATGSPAAFSMAISLGSSSSPSVVAHDGGYAASPSTAWSYISLTVPPLWYYKIAQGGGTTVTLDDWYENNF